MFAEELAVFFDPADHGTEALYDGATVPINGIFDAEYVEPLSIESSGPAYTCAAADVPGVAHGDPLVINGTTYLVRGVKPDGTGVVVLKLEEQ